jgi:hypothetical protein
VLGANANLFWDKTNARLGVGTTSPSYLLTGYNSSAPQLALINATRSFIITNNANDNLLSFFYDGDNRLQFDTTKQWFNTGYVGIGTSSPSSPLHVSAVSGDGVPLLRLTSTSAPGSFNWISSSMNSSLTTSNHTSAHIFGAAQSQYNSGYIGFRYAGGAASASNFVTIGLYASDYILNVLGNGNVGIGTTSPGAPLEVKASLTGFDATGASILKLNNTSSTGQSPLDFVINGTLRGRVRSDYAGNLNLVANGGGHYFFVNGDSGVGSVAICATSSNNVGINTGSPNFNLSVINASDVWHAQFGTSGGKQLRIGGSTTYGSVIGAYNTNDNSSPAALLLQRDGGNVGIGTSNPDTKLVVGGGQTSTNIGAPPSSGTSTTAILRLKPDGRVGGYGEALDFGMNIGPSYGWIQATNYGGLGTNYNLSLQPNGGNVGIGTTSPSKALHVIGDIGASGDIYSSYSDINLKSITGKIENAIDKICSIDAFYYEPNEIAIELGVKIGRKVGVSAQSVQNIMPEVVGESAIGKGYLTVQYERLVPLLIEAIKEQQKQIDELKKQVSL